MIQLFINPDDVKELCTSISGATDDDLILPRIEDAQTTDIERILGSSLYEKIYNDLYNDVPLTDEYLKIFDKYIVRMLAYFTAQYFTIFNETKQSNVGNNILSVANGSPSQKTIQLSEQYKSLAISVEYNFREYMKTTSIPEWTGCNGSEEITNFNDLY